VFDIHNGLEVYAMPMFAAMRMADVFGIAQSYRAALGFGITFAAPGSDGRWLSGRRRAGMTRPA
jgi:hypothetical protein